MTQTPPGWYTDPSGLPGAFRWWDGRQWTQALTNDPANTPPPGTPEAPAAPPPTPQPGGTGGGFPPGPGGDGFPPGPGEGFPPAPGGEGFPPAPRPSEPVPPPAGAPGPGYLPPTYSQRPSMGATEVLGSDLYDDEPSGGRSKLLVAGGIGLAVVLLLGIAGGVWWFTRDSGTPTAVDTPTATADSEEKDETAEPEPEESTTSEPTTPETEESRPTEPTDEPEEPATPARLTFTPLKGQWTENPGLGQALLRNGYAQSLVTEPDWDGPNNDWVAVVSVGSIQPEWAADDLETVAENALDWFARGNFANAKVTRDPLDSSELNVDGHQGVLVKEKFGYKIEGLKATGDTVYVAVVDLGEGRPPGIFLGSVPNTHDHLIGDMDKAVSTLSVE